MKFCTLVGLTEQYLIIDLLVALLGVQIWAPYKTIGLLSESKSMASDLKDHFDRITVRFRPKNALIVQFLIHLCCVRLFLDNNMFKQCRGLFLLAKMHSYSCLRFYYCVRKS